MGIVLNLYSYSTVKTGAVWGEAGCCDPASRLLELCYSGLSFSLPWVIPKKYKEQRLFFCGGELRGFTIGECPPFLPVSCWDRDALSCGGNPPWCQWHLLFFSSCKLPPDNLAPSTQGRDRLSINGLP